MSQLMANQQTYNDLKSDQFLRLYELLVLTRKFEETLIRLYHSGRIRGHPHSSIGQEAVGVGATFALNNEDIVCPSLRTLGALLTKGIPSRIIMAEAYRKKTGPSGGKYLYHHLGDLENGVLLSSAVVGGSIPVIVGTALAAKLKHSRQVSLVFFGDGATSRGDFHEGLNMASVLNVPAVFVCENNLYALSTSQSRQMRIKDVADRARSYGIDGVIVDGCDVLEVYRNTKIAVDKARRGEGPTLIECKTYRWRAHSEIDDPDMDRPPEELNYWRTQRCPIKKLQEYLSNRGILDTAVISRVDNKMQQELEEAIIFAESSPDPAAEETIMDVYA